RRAAVPKEASSHPWGAHRHPPPNPTPRFLSDDSKQQLWKRKSADRSSFVKSSIKGREGNRFESIITFKAGTRS
ncbi:hypothetical protein JRQ81_003169, partial [Phrynocephalus forsythii]